MREDTLAHVRRGYASDWLRRCRRPSKDYEHFARRGERFVYIASITNMLRCNAATT